MKKFIFLLIALLIIGNSKSIARTTYVHKLKHVITWNATEKKLKEIGVTVIKNVDFNSFKIIIHSHIKKNNKSAKIKQILLSITGRSGNKIKNFENEPVSKTNIAFNSCSFAGNGKRGPPSFFQIS